MEDAIARARQTYYRWRSGLSEYDQDENELCQLARSTGLIVPSDGTLAIVDPDADPFDKAHPVLRRAYEQAATEGVGGPSPRTEYRGSMYSSTGVSQAYSTSAERTGGGQDRELPSPEPPAMAHTHGRLALGNADFQDSSWMTWF